jgi:superfamily II RNA helicase
MPPASDASEPSQPNLESLLPEKGYTGSVEEQADAALSDFLDWHIDAGLEPYPHQEEALLEFYGGSNVILATPTGSGKSLVARGVHFLALATGRRSWFTAPIKALVSEKFFSLCRLFGAENVGLMTGDGTVNPSAPIICCTAEVLSTIALRQWDDTPADFVVMDEFHYFGDRDRGMAWQVPLLVMNKARFLLMSATLGDTRAIETDLTERTGHEVAVVKGAKRPIPLDFRYAMAPVHETIDRLVREGKAPVYVVHFTQRACADQAQALLSINYCSKEEKKAISEALRGTRFGTPYGKDLKRILSHGIGLHHAGLLPRYRLAVEKLAQAGLLKVIVGTDTLGVGINVPIRTVVFARLCKFDGVRVRILPVRDFKQIAGRAGRAGFDTEGSVVVQAPEHIIENVRLEDKAKDGKRNKKKFVRRKPPQRGYKHWDEETFKHLVQRPPEALEPVFSINHGVLLSLLQRASDLRAAGERVPLGGGIRMALDLIERSHATRRQKEEMRVQVRTLFESLVTAGVVRKVPLRAGSRCTDVVVDEELQEDFSIDRSLGLWMVAAIDSLDPAHSEYSLDIVSLVEAVQDHPHPVLRAQVHAIKGRMVAEMKAAGLDYDARMEKLEDVTWPQPKGDWIREIFHLYREQHPWLDGEAVRPKSVLREMLASWAGFNEFVHEYGLDRVEGVLLRYLSGCWRTLSKGVPEAAKSDDVIEIEQWLRALLARTDSSLIAAWEQLQSDEADALGLDLGERQVDISEDSRRFKARVRAELHQLVRALSMGDDDEASVLCGDESWTAPVIAKSLIEFEEEYGQRPIFDHRARLAHRTVVEKTGPHQWRVVQTLLDPEEHDEWSILGQIDLRENTDPPGRIVQVIDIRGA